MSEHRYRCGGCHWWVHGSADEGLCFRYPPRVEVAFDRKGAPCGDLSLRPTTLRDEFCGEWRSP